MNDSELDQLLRSSSPDIRPPNGFQQEVWLRVAVADAAAWQPSMSRLLQRFLDMVAMPPVAVATCVALVLAGVWFGLRTESPNSGASGEMAYVESISPFFHKHRK